MAQFQKCKTYYAFQELRMEELWWEGRGCGLAWQTRGPIQTKQLSTGCRCSQWGPFVQPMYYMDCRFPKSPPWEKLGTASVCIIPTSAHESNYAIALRAFKSICFENNYIMPLTTSPWRRGLQVTNAVSWGIHQSCSRHRAKLKESVKEKDESQEPNTTSMG